VAKYPSAQKTSTYFNDVNKIIQEKKSAFIGQIFLTNISYVTSNNHANWIIGKSIVISKCYRFALLSSQAIVAFLPQKPTQALLF
jgi:hypothetical protein